MARHNQINISFREGTLDLVADGKKLEQVRYFLK